MTLLLAFLIGIFAGLRSLTAPAAVAWSVYLGWLKINRPLSFIGSLPAVIVLSVLAAAELVADKLPNTADRTGAAGMLARIVTGGVSGACVAVGGGKTALPGAALGVAGAIVGAHLGYRLRKFVVKRFGINDIYVASAEDFVAIAGCIWTVSRF